MTESTLQITLISMLRLLYPDYVINLSLNGISIPGDIKTKTLIINQMKKEGMENGMPDLLLYLPNGKVLNMELKTDKGKQSLDQIDVQHRLTKLGHNYYIIRTVYEAFKAIAEHTNESDRFEQQQKLIIHHDDKSLTKPFLHFTVGTNLSTVQDTLKNLYHL